MSVPIWRYYLHLFAGAYGLIGVSLASAIVQSALLAALAIAVRYVFDSVLPARDGPLLVAAGASMLALYSMQAGIGLWTRAFTLRVIKQAILQLRMTLIEQVYCWESAAYNQADPGHLHSAIVQDTERVDVLSNALVVQVLPALLTGSVLSAVLLYLNWQLVLVLALIGSLLYVLSRRILTIVRHDTQIFHRSFEVFSTGVLFVLQMRDLTQTTAAEAWETARQHGYVDSLRIASGRMAWSQAAYGVLHNTLLAVAGVIVLIVGGQFVATGVLTSGALVSFYVALALLRESFSTFVGAIPLIVAGEEALQRIYGAMATAVAAPYSGMDTIEFTGAVAATGVYFDYGYQPLFQGADFHIRPHEVVAILGPNGTGKSTLFRLILGFYRPQAGQLWADGQSYNGIDLTLLRRQTGVVPQEPALFFGTVRENIAYGWPGTQPGEIEAAARWAAADDFIQALPKGYETCVGAGGVRLSGGQRQRLALARALMHRPALLLLDEPTNHLDGATVRTILNNLRQLPDSPAILIATHDREVVSACTRAYVIQEGRLLECDPTAPIAVPECATITKVTH